jgi:hypothetical protein
VTDERRCLHCGAALDSPRRFYCSNAHRQRAWRRRRAGFPPDMLPNGGRRGPTPLGVTTRTEEQAWLRAEMLTVRPRAA